MDDAGTFYFHFQDFSQCARAHKHTHARTHNTTSTYLYTMLRKCHEYGANCRDKKKEYTSKEEQVVRDEENVKKYYVLPTATTTTLKIYIYHLQNLLRRVNTYLWNKVWLVKVASHTRRNE